MRIGLALTVAMLATTAAPVAGAAEKSLALFATTLVDTSTEGAINGVRDDETARLALFDETLRQKLEKAGYVIVDVAPVADELERTVNPAQCNGCARRMAERLGADFVMTSEVQKVSNLILSLHLVMQDVTSGKVVRSGSADIRGNTDTSWLRGQRWLLKNRLFNDDPK